MNIVTFDNDAKRIGLVVADEKQAIMEYFKDRHLVKLTWNKFEVYWANQGIINLYILFCGCGEVQASSGTQYLIDNFNVDQIINYGVVGGINPNYGKHFSEEIKEKIRQGNKAYHQGTHWMTNGIKRNQIRPCAEQKYLEDGWWYVRKDLNDK